MAPTVTLNASLIGRWKPAKIFADSVEQPPPPMPPARAAQTPPRHITSITFDDRGDVCVTGGEDDAIRVYNCRTGKNMKTFYSRKYGVDLVRSTHSSSTILHTSTGEDHAIRYHSLHDNKYLQFFKGHKDRVISLEMSPLDDCFISAAQDNCVRLWDLRQPTCRGLLTLPDAPVVAFDHSGLVFAVAVNRHNRVLLYDQNNYDKEPFISVRIEDPVLSRITFPPRIPIITSLSFSSDGKWLLVGTSGEVHYILDSFEGHLVARLTGHIGLERGKSGATFAPQRGISGEELSWTPDSKYVIGGSHDGKIIFWEVGTRDLQAPLPGADPLQIEPSVSLDGHPGPSRCVAFNPRFALLATGSSKLAFWLPDQSAEGEPADKKK